MTTYYVNSNNKLQLYAHAQWVIAVDSLSQSASSLRMHINYLLILPTVGENASGILDFKMAAAAAANRKLAMFLDLSQLHTARDTGDAIA